MMVVAVETEPTFTTGQPSQPFGGLTRAPFSVRGCRPLTPNVPRACSPSRLPPSRVPSADQYGVAVRTDARFSLDPVGTVRARALSPVMGDRVGHEEEHKGQEPQEEPACHAFRQ